MSQSADQPTPSSLLPAFEQEGERIEAGGNRPFLLDDPDNIWMVQTGRVDVFIVRIENGEAVGRRRHLLRVEAGEIMIGVVTDASRPVGLLAVGFSGTTLFRMPTVKLATLRGDEVIKPAVTAALDQWIKKTSAGLAHDIPPKDYEIIEPDQDISLATGKNAGALSGVLWVRHVEGTSRFLGRIAANGDGCVPVTEHTWIEVEEPAVVHAISTDDFLNEDTIRADIRAFHNAILTIIHDDLAQIGLQEKQRMADRSQADDRTFRQAVTRLAGVLDDHEDADFMTSGGEAPLLTAARWVGDAMGIAVEAPPAVRIDDDPQKAEGEAQNFRLSDIARASKIRIRQVVLAGDWWNRDHGPLLGRIEESKQPVALLPASATGYDLADPVEGGRRRITPEVAATLSPFANTFYRSLPARALNGLDLLKAGIYGCRNDLMVILFMGVAGGLLGLVTPIATGHLFDTIIPEAQRGQLYQLTAALIISAFSFTLFNVVKSISLLRVEGKMNMSIQAAVWDRLLNLPTAFFRRYTAGDLAMRAMGINQIRQVISGVVVTTVLSSLFSVFHFGLLFFYAWKLALVGVGLAAVFLGITLTISYYSLRYQRLLADIEGAVSGMVLQFITGIGKLRVAAAEGRAFGAWSARFSEKKRIAFKAGTVQNYLEAVISVFPVVSSMAIFALALQLIKETLEAGDPAITTGDFLAFNASFTLFLTAALELSMAMIAALSIIPLYRRAKPLLEELPEISAVKTHPGVLKGGIEVNQVSFRYTEDGPTILEDVSMQIEPGDYVALVGPSGSGKSTMLRLLMGFEQPTAGSIYYDSRDLSDLDVGEVRRQAGVVLQNGQLRSGSLFTNIIGSARLTLDDAWEAARMAGLDKDIEEMPMGMHTVIDSNASGLSGGQRQRLMIARAIVSRPRILFFDEATSALDNRTQTIVSRSLDRLQATRIVIAHRLSTIIHADRIYVLEGGRLAQAGSYDELMAQEGLFAELARRQIA